VTIVCAFLTTNYEVLGSILGPTIVILSLIGEDPHCDHCVCVSDY
jgi:hypothetical protein